MNEYVVNAPPTRAVTLDDYLAGRGGLPLSVGYTIEASSAVKAIEAIKAYRVGRQWAVDLASAGRINIF